MTADRVTRLSLVARLASRLVPEPGATSVQGHEGRGETVDELLASHADAVYRYALRLTRDPTVAQDLMQETLLRGWRRRHLLREPRAGRTWLLTIATNLHRDGVRSGQPTVALTAAEAASPGCGVETRAEQRECVVRALAALDELPARQRQVMHLVTIEQLSHGEAAAVLEISVDALKANLSAARRTMRERLRDVYDDIRGVRTEER